MAIRCLHCGASNADGADWCGQCFEPFAAPVAPPAEPAPQPQAEPQPQPDPAPVRERPVGDGPPDEPQWTCPVCEAGNPITSDACATCGTSMIKAFGGDSGDAPIDESAVRLWSFLPGAGHMKAGAALTGGATLLVVAMALGFGFSLLGAATTRAVGIVILVVGAGTWLASAWDVEQWLRTRGEWLLQPRVLSAIAGVVLILLMTGVFLAL